MDPLKRATLSAEAMWRDDKASSNLGMTMHVVEPGKSKFSMIIEINHANGYGICHGGFIYLLADSAFAYACNSYNRPCVAYHNSITYLNSAQVGDELTAHANEVSLRGRNGIYDVGVTNQDGTIIAQFRGLSRMIKGHWFEEGTDDE